MGAQYSSLGLGLNDASRLRSELGLSETSRLRSELEASRQREADEREARHRAEVRAAEVEARHASELQVVRSEVELRVAQRQIEELKRELSSLRRTPVDSPSFVSSNGINSNEATAGTSAQTRGANPVLTGPESLHVVLATEMRAATGQAPMHRAPSDAAESACDAARKKAFAAFLSHSKADAAMEARYLQSELESLLKRPVFLDSDDLRDLRDLEGHVRDSEVLVLLQTKNVLTRPFCILELVTAVDAGIPIFGVSLSSGPYGYNYEAANGFLLNLDTALPSQHPAATQTLAQWGVRDLRLAAWKLANTVPSAISVPFNPSASRNMLAAMLCDLQAAIAAGRDQEAKLPPMAEWLQWRKDEADAADVTTTSKTPALLARVPPGVGLQQMAKAFPSVYPLAFLVQAISVLAAKPTALRADCELFALSVETMEQLLLASTSLNDDIVKELILLLERAMLQLQMIIAADGDAHNGDGRYDGGGGGGGGGAACTEPESRPAPMAPSSGHLSAALLAQAKELEQIRRQMAQLASLLYPEKPIDVSILREESPALAASCSGRRGSSWDAARRKMAARRDQLQHERDELLGSKQQLELAQARNNILVSHTQQMVHMSEQGDMKPLNFIQRFPLCIAEAERQMAVNRTRMLETPLPVAGIESILSGLTASARLGPQLRALIVMIIHADWQRAVALHCEDGHGGWLDSVGSGMLDLEPIPRKSAACQYVLQADKFVCFRGTDKAHFKLMNPLKALDPEQLGALSAIDSQLEASMKPGGFIGLQSDSRYMENHPGVRRIREVLSATDCAYLGVPLRFEGQTVGSLCCLLHNDLPPEDDLGHERQIVEQAALDISAVVKSLAQAHEELGTRSSTRAGG